MILYKDWAISFADNPRDGLVVCIVSGITRNQDNAPLRLPHHSNGGVAFCSVKDEFDKVKGMRVALHRALQSGLVPVDEHPAIWKEWVRRYVKNDKKQSRYNERVQLEDIIGRVHRLDRDGSLKPVV